jgi:hypothetical protein
MRPRVAIALVLTALAACAGPPAAPVSVTVPPTAPAPSASAAAPAVAGPATSTPTPAPSLVLRGTLRVTRSHPLNAKSFDGVTLRTQDGTEWIVSYVIDALLEPFDGVEITLEGEKYAPPGQALIGPHVSPMRWEAVDWRKAGALERVEREQELEGTFDVHTWPAGTKLAGDAMRVFRAASGTQYFLARAPSPEPARGQRVRIRARVVEPTRLEQRPGGPYLWVLEVLP